MTTRYRVEYALKTHRRDQLIEWIKGLLAVPFVLHSQPTAALEGQGQAVEQMAKTASKRYAEIFKDVERLISDHIIHVKDELGSSKLKHLVPSIGTFFTPLYLEQAFLRQDEARKISSRRFVPPSFNDVRLILNSAQLLGIFRHGELRLVTFDGDVTLYDDGMSLVKDNPVIPRIMDLLCRGIKVGIVTAAGYTEPEPYAERLRGLLDAIWHAERQAQLRDPQLVVLGGECNYLLTYSSAAHPTLLNMRPRSEWLLPEMRSWTHDGITALLDIAQAALAECVQSMSLPAKVLRKERAVGIVPHGNDELSPPPKFTREQLEETVLVTQQVLEAFVSTSASPGRNIPFCAFNGGADVFVDIGDKSWGVKCIQSYLGRSLPDGIRGHETLHVGDQFLSAGANDFKARSACCTAWIANPEETVSLLDELDRSIA